MKKEIYCKYCGAFLGSLHMQEKGLAIVKHFKKEHPKELAEMKMAKQALQILKEEYGFIFTYADDFLNR